MRWVGMAGWILGLLVAGYLALYPTGTAVSEPAAPAGSPPIATAVARVSMRDESVTRAAYIAAAYYLTAGVLVWRERRLALGVLGLVGLAASLLAGFSVGPLFLVPTLMLFLSAAAGIRSGPRTGRH